MFGVDHAILGVLGTVLRDSCTGHAVRGNLVAANKSTFLAYNVDHAIHSGLYAVLWRFGTGYAVRGMLVAAIMGT